MSGSGEKLPSAWVDIGYLEDDDYVADDGPADAGQRCSAFPNSLDDETRRSLIDGALEADVSHLGPEVAALVMTLRRLRRDCTAAEDRLIDLLLEVRSCNPLSSW